MFPRPRARLLGLGAWGAAVILSVSCTTEAAPPSRRAEEQRPDPGRLRARPQQPDLAALPAGLHPLGLAAGRDGLTYVPAGYRPDRAAPLVVSLHGAGGDARGGIDPLRALADQAGLLLVAPDSRAATWDVIAGGYGPDVAFIDRALEQTFRRYAVDPGRVAVAGFSDGASYGLSLGLTNGDLFRHVVAFSPGFAAPATRRGAPRLFVSHGIHDTVLPIGSTSRRIVPRMRRDNLEVDYREFDGGHTVPPEIAREAVSWLLAAPA